MKKWLMLILAMVVLVACSDKNENTTTNEKTDSSDSNEVEAESDTNEEQSNKIYGIGETAVVTSDLYEFDYEVTVTDFQIMDEVDGENIFDFVLGLEESDPTRFAVVYVTIKNISDEAYVPNEMFSANLSNVDEEAGVVSETQFSTELDQELEPGEEVDSKVVYTYYTDEDAYWFKYEIMSDEETIFELPNPKK